MIRVLDLSDEYQGSNPEGAAPIDLSTASTVRTAGGSRFS